MTENPSDSTAVDQTNPTSTTDQILPRNCPFCGSTQITFKKKASLWECESCEERFNDQNSSSLIRNIDEKTMYPKDIFFSYGHDDNRDLVRLFKGDLEKRGHKIWFDEKDIGDWDDWKGKITRGIDSSQLAVAFISRHSIRDPGVCLNEIAIAMNRFGSIYPVLLETSIEQDIPITIRHLQWPDLSLWKKIRNGEVPNVEWKRWYEEKLINFIDKIEGEATQFADETQVLENVLKPSKIESKVAQHVPGFIGRKWIFETYKKWVDHQPESRLFWIKAGPGVGKTAIAANLVHQERSAIVAGWFCDASSIDRNNPNKALQSIAFQLALRWEDYRVVLMRKFQLNSNSSSEECEIAQKEIQYKNTHDTFEFLFTEPMTGLIWREQKLVIVIDALDEATDQDGNNPITDLICGQLSTLPPWIGFIVTSRPEAEVVNRLHGFKPTEINALDPRNISDIENWYSKRLEIRPELCNLTQAEKQKTKEQLINLSGGMILYLKVIEEGFKEGSLEVAQLAKLQSGLPGLYRRYYDSFEKRFHTDYEESIKPLLRLIFALGRPLSEELACETLGWNSEQFLVCRNHLGSYVVENHEGFQIFHNTLTEWLTNKASGKYYVDKSIGYQLLSDVFFKELAEKEYWEVRWPVLRMMNWLPNIKQYNDELALTHLAYWVRGVGDIDSAKIIYERLLEIVESKRGMRDLSLLPILNQLGWILFIEGSYEMPEIMLRRAFEIMDESKVYPPEYSEAIENYQNLVIPIYNSGNFDRAKALQLELMNRCISWQGESSVIATSSYIAMGDLMKLKGCFSEAKTYYLKAIEIREQKGSQDVISKMLLKKKLDSVLNL